MRIFFQLLAEAEVSNGSPSAQNTAKIFQVLIREMPTLGGDIFTE